MASKQNEWKIIGNSVLFKSICWYLLYKINKYVFTHYITWQASELHLQIAQSAQRTLFMHFWKNGYCPVYTLL